MSAMAAKQAFPAQTTAWALEMEALLEVAVVVAVAVRVGGRVAEWSLSPPVARQLRHALGAAALGAP